MSEAKLITTDAHGMARGPDGAMYACPAGSVIAKDSVAGSNLSPYGLLWTAGLEGAAGPQLNEPLAPYQQSLWVHRCVKVKADTASGIPFRLSRGGALSVSEKGFTVRCRAGVRGGLRSFPGRKAVIVGRAAEGEVVDDSPAGNFLARPNSYEDFPAFFARLVSMRELRGAAAIYMTDFTGRRPGQMHVIDGRRVKPVWGGTRIAPELLGYVYKGRGGEATPLGPDEVKYFHLWSDDDEDPLRGLSSLAPARLAIATDYNASLFTASALTNGSEVGLTITFPGRLDAIQRDEFRAGLRARQGGAGNAKKELVLEDGATAEAMGSVLKDLELSLTQQRSRLEICCIEGVPPAVAGWLEGAGAGSGFATVMGQALMFFFQQTMFPLLDGYAPAFQEIVSRFDATLVFGFHVEDQPVVRDMRTSQMDSAAKLFAMGRPFADVNDWLDLGLPAREWDETGFLAQGLVPAKDLAEGHVVPSIPEGPPAEEEPGQQGPTGDQGPGETPQGETLGLPALGNGLSSRSPIPGPRPLVVKAGMGERLWKAWESSWAPLARGFRSIIMARLLRQQRALLRALKARASQIAAKEFGDSITIRQSDGDCESKGLLEDVLREVFADAADQRVWRSRVEKFVKDAQELGLRQALVEAGMSGDAMEAAAKRLLADESLLRAMRRETIIISTKIDAATREQLRRSLAEGMAEGENYADLTDRVREGMNNRRAAAAQVARNAVATATSQSRHEGQSAMGMTHKIWLHSRGPGQPRESHVAAERQYAHHPIPHDQPFIVDGVPLMYPRDPSGPAEETINCQCIEIGVRVAGGKWIIAMPTGFYTYERMMEARKAA